MAPVKDKELDTVPVQQVAEYDPNRDTWESMFDGADKVLGHDLTKDDLFDALIGVPFLITRVTFRKGIKRDSRQFAYVSCEAVIAPTEVLRRRRVNVDNLPFDADSTIVFNDGSTGIYRQVVQYLAAKGMIAVPEGNEQGAHGDTVFDTTPGEWTAIHGGKVTVTDDGWTDYTANVRVACTRGIRISEYENDFNPSGSKTRYLA